MLKTRVYKTALFLIGLFQDYDFLFQSPLMLTSFLDTLFIFSGNGFILAMLEPHLREFAGATQSQVGTAFFLQGVTYTVTALATGWVMQDLFLSVLFLVQKEGESSPFLELTLLL